MMAALALPSLRHRTTSFTASFVAVALSTLVIGAFGTVAAAGLGGVADADAEILLTMGAVIGG